MSDRGSALGNAATLDLALIGNCAISALVDPRARIAWCCMPRFDGDPVFHALLDSGGGIGEDGTFSMVGIVNGAVRLSKPWDHVV